MKCGLIGESLLHSYSPQIHKSLVADEYSYELCQISRNELENFVTSRRLDAYNVTIPYKKAIIPYLDFVSDQALKIGAVNTVVTSPDGRLCGYNTDYFGFMKTVERLNVDLKGKKALVLGSGGASRTAQTVLSDLGADVTVISRSGNDNYKSVYDLHADASFIVNCTPVGMYPNTGESPIDISRFPRLSGVVDMVYNPYKTKLIYDAESLGVPVQNGLLMLVSQAAAASELFLGGQRKLTDADIDRITNEIACSAKNIILVGMPGSGKSTVGKLVADKLSREFIDTDALIVQRSGMDIPSIFEKYGEEEFRRIETSVCADVGKLNGKVISTGGGVVTRAENRYSIKQNSTVFFVDRDLSALPTDDRPLSQKASLDEMLKARLPLYLDFSDYKIDNCGLPEEAADKIIKIIREG